MIDFSSEFGRRAERKLREGLVIWLTTIDRRGTPQPIPVWFLWDGRSVLIYSQPETAKLRNIAQNPKVALNFDGNGAGGDIVVLTGEARIESDQPSADQVPEYLAKYAQQIRRIGYSTDQAFAASYSVAIRVTLERLRGF